METTASCLCELDCALTMYNEYNLNGYKCKHQDKKGEKSFQRYNKGTFSPRASFKVNEADCPAVTVAIGMCFVCIDFTDTDLKLPFVSGPKRSWSRWETVPLKFDPPPRKKERWKKKKKAVGATKYKEVLVYLFYYFRKKVYRRTVPATTVPTPCTENVSLIKNWVGNVRKWSHSYHKNEKIMKQPNCDFLKWSNCK